MTSIGIDGSVEFRFFRPGASDVRVAGDFDGWSGQTPMEHLGQGWWSARATLKTGEYRFRYVADGQWYTDYAANGVEYNKAGLNSILVVPQVMRARQQERADELEHAPKLTLDGRPSLVKVCA